MLEIVLESLGDSAPAAVAEHAIRIATRPFEELGIEVSQRPFDSGEESNLQAATEVDGRVNLREFILCQSIHRNELEISPSIRTISAIYSPAIVRTREELIIPPFGYSIASLHEATLSTHKLRIQLLKNPRFNEYAAHFFAYTLAHEAGHLFDLVSPEADRHMEGMHCCNECVMKSTNIVETADYLQATNGSIEFCEPCTEDILDTVAQD